MARKKHLPLAQLFLRARLAGVFSFLAFSDGAARSAALNGEYDKEFFEIKTEKV